MNITYLYDLLIICVIKATLYYALNCLVAFLCYISDTLITVVAKMTLDIDKLVKLGLIDFNDENIIKSGVMHDNNNKEIDYRVSFGWDLVSACLCDKDWKIYRFNLIEYIEKNFESNEIQKILSSIQIEDYHWKWVSKSMVYNSDEHKWFYLKTGNKIEAACLAYHPKKSAVDSEDIFYIEFIAVAPWNRDDPMSPKKLQGIGSSLLKTVIKYLVDSLGLTYRFGLHALPQASGYYTKIGMDYISLGDKDSLEYFEMSNHNSINFVNG